MVPPASNAGFSFGRGSFGMLQDDDLQSRSDAVRPLTPRRLRAVFLDLVGRPPLQKERDLWAGKPLGDLLGVYLGSLEYWSNWLEEQLYFLLLVDNFRPREDGLWALPEALTRRSLGVRDALHRIALTATFDRRNPGPDTFVTVVMEQFLGTTVQKDPRMLEVGKNLYDGNKGIFLGKQGDSQSDVIRIVMEDRKMMRFLVNREYKRTLRKAPSAGEGRDWARTMGKDALAWTRLVREWITSAAYEERLLTREEQPNRVFVRSLFVDLVDRLPAHDEAQRLQNALDGLADSSPLRSVLARLLLDSGVAKVPQRETIEDATAWVQGLFEKLLGRSALPDELKTFATALADPACQPKTVVYAIVSHPEYHSW